MQSSLRTLRTSARAHWRGTRRGASALSYGLLLGLVSIGALSTVQSSGTSVAILLCQTAAAISGGDDCGDTREEGGEPADGNAPLFSIAADLGTISFGGAPTQIIAASDDSGIDRYALSAGSLPIGITLNTQTGALEGEARQGGRFTFTITAYDLAGNEASAEFTLGIPGPAVFSATGADQTMPAPSGVGEIEVKLWGAGGGGSWPRAYPIGQSAAQAIAGDGGGGAFVHALVPVTGTEMLTLIVGEGGYSHRANSLGEAVYGGGGRTGAGLFNDASFDGTLDERYNGFVFPDAADGVADNRYLIVSGAGGGRSALRLDGVEVLTAAGGGGGGDAESVCGNLFKTGVAAHGGPGGLAFGFDGANWRNGKGGVTGVSLDALPGTGSGGAAGNNDYSTPTCAVGQFCNPPGSAGAPFAGGNGNTGQAGGGGGYYGGGASGSFSCSAGGGGGSSFIGVSAYGLTQLGAERGGGPSSTVTPSPGGVTFTIFADPTPAGGDDDEDYTAGVGSGGRAGADPVAATGGSGHALIDWVVPPAI